jgi:hypothetical protein
MGLVLSDARTVALPVAPALVALAVGLVVALVGDEVSHPMETVIRIATGIPIKRRMRFPFFPRGERGWMNGWTVGGRGSRTSAATIQEPGPVVKTRGHDSPFDFS